MNINDIIDSVQSNRVNITHHAREEAKNDSYRLDDIFYSTCNGEIIENYPRDKPYPSCLIFGESSKGKPIHSVWGYDSESRIAVLITVYHPNPDLWIDYKKRKKP